MDLAVSVYGIIDYALTMRDDITVIFVCHSQTVRDDSGYLFTSIKTNGQKLSKIGLENEFLFLNLETLETEEPIEEPTEEPTEVPAEESAE